MEDDYIKPKEFRLPVIESKSQLKGKKAVYKQYSVKLPKGLVNLLDFGKNDELVFRFSPIRGEEKYPKFEVEVMRNGRQKKG